jgi:hypothetical protein
VGEDPGCELCEAAPLTERFHEDDLCWIAECESCSVPMIVWREHDPEPPAAVRSILHERLLAVVTAHFDGEIWIDERLRSIPTHYHAHARPRRGHLGDGLRRRAVDPPPTTAPTATPTPTPRSHRP